MHNICHAQISQLPIKYPDVHYEFMYGCFSIQLGPENSFGIISVQQIIEVTANKVTQRTGGHQGVHLESRSNCHVQPHLNTELCTYKKLRSAYVIQEQKCLNQTWAMDVQSLMASVRENMK